MDRPQAYRNMTDLMTVYHRMKDLVTGQGIRSLIVCGNAGNPHQKSRGVVVCSSEFELPARLKPLGWLGATGPSPQASARRRKTESPRAQKGLRAIGLCRHGHTGSWEGWP